MVAKPSELKGWSIQWSVQPGAFFLAPPKKGYSEYANWLEDWVEVDTSRSPNYNNTYNRVFKAEEECSNHIFRLLNAIDCHEGHLTSLEIELYVQVAAYYRVHKKVLKAHAEFLHNLLKKLNNER